jgi:hypothetical protein
MSDIHVEVVYALAQEQRLVELVLSDGATVTDALSRIAESAEFADLELNDAAVGIYGRVIKDRAQRLNEGDRLEIYRPLSVDPMTARRLRASRKEV